MTRRSIWSWPHNGLLSSSGIVVLIPGSYGFHNVPDGVGGEAFPIIFRHTGSFLYASTNGVSGIYFGVDGIGIETNL